MTCHSQWSIGEPQITGLHPVVLCRLCLYLLPAVPENMQFSLVLHISLLLFLCGLVMSTVVFMFVFHDIWPCMAAGYSTPALKQLHWLPIKFRIIFKVATVMHNILHNRSPPYLKDLVTFSVSGPQRGQLRSTTTRSAVVLRTRTQFGRHAFSVCGPDIWNSLPVNIRLIDSHPSFRRALKSHIFNIAFSYSILCMSGLL